MALVVCCWCIPSHVLREDPSLKLDSHVMCEKARKDYHDSLERLPTRATCPHGRILSRETCVPCQAERGGGA